jgi:hypothetical protein
MARVYISQQSKVEVFRQMPHQYQAKIEEELCPFGNPGRIFYEH